VRASLAAALGDPRLRLLYRQTGASAYVDARGEPATPDPRPGRALTRLVRHGVEIAVMDHDADLLAEPRVVEAAISAARLAVDNERLQAELLAQARELRESRRRIVEAADGERRRLERDLHDGAQQRIVGLTITLGLLRALAPGAGAQAALDAAGSQLREVLAALREVAHGIYPAALVAEGLPAAFEDLSEHIGGRVRVDAPALARPPLAVEQAAYFAVSETVHDLGPSERASVRSKRVDDQLVVEIERSGSAAAIAARLETIGDRVGALGGGLAASPPEDGSVKLEVRIPCAS
jgi:signal transduction histidine kinase